MTRGSERNVVVGAAIIRAGRLLAAQRSEPPELAGGWEFPGGKVDLGESDEEALIRECQEELGVTVKLAERVGGDWPVHHGWVMRVWTAGLTDGEPRALEHSALRWLGTGELYDVDWLSADLPILDLVRPHLSTSRRELDLGARRATRQQEFLPDAPQLRAAAALF